MALEVGNGLETQTHFRRQIDRLGYTHESIAAVRGTLNISELTRSLLAENKVKECPELTALKRNYSEGVDILEQKIRDAEERIRHELQSHHQTRQAKEALEVQTPSCKLADVLPRMR